jgi:hypothetical protein
MSSARLRHTINSLLGSMTPGAAPGAGAVLDVFDQELDAHAELVIAGPGGPAGFAGATAGAGPMTGGASPPPSLVGFLTRGEGVGFTERAASVLQRFDVPPAAREHHRFLAEMSEHKRAFFKVEWHRQPGGRVAPAASCYFRRRPELDAVLAALDARGLARGLQDQLRLLAFTLDKRTVMFAAATFRPGAPVHHKLYFSQYVTPATAPAVIARLERVLDRLAPEGPDAQPGARAGDGGQRAPWQRAHAHTLAGAPESTILVSVAFTDRDLLPGLKIDYPEVTPAQAAAWAPEERRPQVEREVRDACAGAGAGRLSYLGVRLQGDRAAALKYYVPVQAPRELP